MQMYLVGGAVRDSLLGISSKDYDFTVVLDESDLPAPGTTVTEPDPFKTMVNNLKLHGLEVFLESPEYLTVRARFPSKEVKVGGTIDKFAFANSCLTADFVLARKESGYTDGRRPDEVVPGTLEDDLARRDFTMNAIAKDSEGNLIDPFGGVQDINDRVVRAVGNAFDRLEEDALRAVRALRFSVTKGFRIDNELKFAMNTHAVLDSIVNNISDERIQQELSKMFRFDTVASLHLLSKFPLLTDAMFAGSVSLDATMKLRGRGK